MVIKNVKVYTENQEFVSGEVVIRDGRFAEGEAPDDPEEVLDGE